MTLELSLLAQHYIPRFTEISLLVKRWKGRDTLTTWWGQDAIFFPTKWV